MTERKPNDNIADVIQRQEFEALREHINHHVVVVCYGSTMYCHNVAVECEDCSVVLYDRENPDV